MYSRAIWQAVGDIFLFQNKVARQVFKETVKIFQNKLVEDGVLKIPGMGKFTLKFRPAGRRTTNPRTGQVIATRAKVLVRFKPSATLKKLVQSAKISTK